MANDVCPDAGHTTPKGITLAGDALQLWIALLTILTSLVTKVT